LAKEKGKGKIVLLLAVIAVVLMAAALVTVLIAPSFDSEFGEMAKIWLERGVKEEKLHLAIDELKELPESTLLEIKGELALFKARAKNDSTLHLATVYDSLIDYVLREKRATSAMAALSSASGNACGKLAYYEKLVEESESLLDSANSYAANASDFAMLHTGQSQKIALFSSETISKKDTQLDEMKHYLSALKEVCK